MLALTLTADLNGYTINLLARRGELILPQGHRFGAFRYC